jgi:hypothetical protein
MKNPRFTLDMFGDGLEWGDIMSLATPTGKYRVEIQWCLDCYRLWVWFRTAEPERLVRHCWAKYDYTAVERANRLLRAYTARENFSN